MWLCVSSSLKAARAVLPGRTNGITKTMREKVRLISSAKTGYSYYTTKNKQKQTDKIQLKKYDPIVRKHVLFTETKMPSHSKK